MNWYLYEKDGQVWWSDNPHCYMPGCRLLAGKISHTRPVKISIHQESEIEHLAEQCSTLLSENEQLRADLEITRTNMASVQARAGETGRLRAALRLIAWDIEGQEPDVGECMMIAAAVLAEHVGPESLEVIEIEGSGHYVNGKVKAEIGRLRAELKKAYAQLYPAQHAGRILDRLG